MASLLLMAGAIALAILGIGKLLKALWHLLQKMVQVHLLIEKELQNNGGSSMKDGVERINRRLDGIEDRLGNLEQTAEQIVGDDSPHESP